MKQEGNEVGVALYARVSSEEQVEGYSIDAQKRAFRLLAKDRKWIVSREYIEEGKSARTDDINKRPVFKEMIGDATAKKFDVLVVHKLDRFSRNLRITLEYFYQLAKYGVTFFSITEQIDFTTPQGKVNLAINGAFAQYYSDNLSLETKKGWAERKAQGIYCGPLPFGALKGEDKIPVQNPTTYPGLLLAFHLAAQGKSCREIAMALNEGGYRTAGNFGNRPFCKDTVHYMLQNPFYRGYLPNGDDKPIKAKHQPFIDKKLWDKAQEARERNRTAPKNHPSHTTISSLTGITYCWHCKGRMHIGVSGSRGKRMLCFNRIKRMSCSQKSVLIEVLEDQIERYLEMFHIPEDYQEKILQAHKKLQAAYVDSERERSLLQGRLERIKKLFQWGDIPEKEYVKEKAELVNQLQKLNVPETDTIVLEKLALFLKSVASAWKESNQDQRNRIARQLFKEVWVKDKQVIAVKPMPELESFFKLSYDEWLKKFERMELRLP